MLFGEDLNDDIDKGPWEGSFPAVWWVRGGDSEWQSPRWPSLGSQFDQWVEETVNDKALAR